MLLTVNMQIRCGFHPTQRMQRIDNASTLAMLLLRRLRSLRILAASLASIVLEGPALRWMETKPYLDDEVVN